MSLSKILINRTNGNLGGEPANEDHITGLIFYKTGVTPNTYLFYTLQDVDNAGFTYSNGTNGVKSLINYQLSEYFKFSNYKIYVKTVSATPSTYSEMVDLQNYANGTITKIGIYDGINNFAQNKITAIQTQCTALKNDYSPVVAFVSFNSSAGYLNPTDLRQFNSPQVAVINGDDFGGQASTLRTNTIANHIGSIGNALGLSASIQVNQCIGEVAIGNVTSENFVDPALNDGTKVSTLSTALKDTLDTYKYNFLMKYKGNAGTFYNFDNTCTTDTDDFKRIGLNLVWNKAFRLLYQAYLPYLNSQNVADKTTGYLTPIRIKTLEGAGNNALEVMLKAGEISGYSVYIKPEQNILSTQLLDIQVDIVPTSTNKTIRIALGYKLKLN